MTQKEKVVIQLPSRGLDIPFMLLTGRVEYKLNSIKIKILIYPQQQKVLLYN